jgi:hypothetical protein
MTNLINLAELNSNLQTQYLLLVFQQTTAAKSLYRSIYLDDDI